MIAEIFLMVGITVSVTLSDAIVCLVLTVFIEHVEKELDSDLFLLPALFVNSFGFIVVSAYSIYKTIAG